MSYEGELTGLRKAIDEWQSVGTMTGEQERITLAHLIERYPDEARQILRDHDEATARRDEKT